MFDYIFARIVKAKTTEEVNAILFACDSVESLTETQRNELTLLGGLQSEVIILQSIVDISDKNLALYRELTDSYEDIMQTVYDALEEVK